MAMIFIGSTLATYRFGDIIKSRIAIEASIVKLILLPLLTVGMVYFLPVPDMTKCILVLGISFPTAATVSMLAEQGRLRRRNSQQDTVFVHSHIDRDHTSCHKSDKHTVLTGQSSYFFFFVSRYSVKNTSSLSRSVSILSITRFFEATERLW